MPSRGAAPCHPGAGAGAVCLAASRAPIPAWPTHSLLHRWIHCPVPGTLRCLGGHPRGSDPRSGPPSKEELCPQETP